MCCAVKWDGFADSVDGCGGRLVPPISVESEEYTGVGEG